MLAAMHLTPIGDLAEVEPVLEQVGKGTHAEAETDNIDPLANLGSPISYRVAWVRD